LAGVDSFIFLFVLYNTVICTRFYYKYTLGVSPFTTRLTLYSMGCAHYSYRSQSYCWVTI